MRLSEVVRPECIAVNVELADKEEALRKAAELAKRCSVLEAVDLERIVAGLRERESMSSTGFGNGIAIPHCRLEGVAEFVAGAMTVPPGIGFDAVDGRDVRIIAFIIGPTAETTEHLRILSALSLSLGTVGTPEAILAARTPEALLGTLVHGAEEEIDLRGHADKRLFYVVVQEEALFERILGAFESLDSASVSVLDGTGAGEYLAKVPLFASLFSDDYTRFNRLIMAVIGREMTNEAIRRIESVTGRLDRARNVLVAVQDLFYAAGSLEI